MIRMFAVNMPDNVEDWLRETLHSGYLTEGPRVRQFETEFMTLTDCPVAAVNSGTSALTLALASLGNAVKNPVVISTPMTCAATNLPVLTQGMNLVWADINPETGLIDPDSVQKQIRRYGSKVVAVMVVDWGGAPAPVFEIKRDNPSMPVIEDAAHAIGGRHSYDVPVGAAADMTCFSFQAIKHLTTGDGGAVSSKDFRYLDRIKLLRWFGIDREADVMGDSRIDVDIEVLGYKMHMNDVAAAIGLAQLSCRPKDGDLVSSLDMVIEKHRENAKYYDANLNEAFFSCGPEPSTVSSCWLYTIRLPRSGLQAGFRRFMRDRGVEVSQVHRRNDTYSVFQRTCPPETLPGVTEFASTMMCLPVHSKLTERDLEKVVATANEYARTEL